MSTNASDTPPISAPQIAYVNGEFLPENEAKVSIFDRGFLFGDGIYEVTPVIDGRLVDRAAHMSRLKRSLGEVRIEPPIPLTDIDRLFCIYRAQA